jgi:hypothetical protein
LKRTIVLVVLFIRNCCFFIVYWWNVNLIKSGADVTGEMTKTVRLCLIDNVEMLFFWGSHDGAESMNVFHDKYIKNIIFQSKTVFILGEI